MHTNVTLEQARSLFEPGIYRHYKGGLYIALALAANHENPQATSVVYRSCAYGEVYHRPLAEAPSAWCDHVEWPSREDRGWPWGASAPRFVLIHPSRFRTVLLLGGTPGVGIEALAEYAGTLEGVLATPTYGGLSKVRSAIHTVLADKVSVPLWFARGEPPPPDDNYLSVDLGADAYVHGQIVGITRAVDPAGPVIETHGRPVTETA